MARRGDRTDQQREREGHLKHPHLFPGLTDVSDLASVIGRILHLRDRARSKFLAAWIAHRDSRDVTRIVAGGATPRTFLRTPRPSGALSSLSRSPGNLSPVSLPAPAASPPGGASALQELFVSGRELDEAQTIIAKVEHFDGELFPRVGSS